MTNYTSYTKWGVMNNSNNNAEQQSVIISNLPTDTNGDYDIMNHSFVNVNHINNDYVVTGSIFDNHINSRSVHGVTGYVVGTDGAQILKNKLISSSDNDIELLNGTTNINNLINQDVRNTATPSFRGITANQYLNMGGASSVSMGGSFVTLPNSITTSGISGDFTINFPTVNDTLVGASSTNTLTNKTINSSNNTIQVSGTNINDLIDQDMRTTAYTSFAGVSVYTNLNAFINSSVDFSEASTVIMPTSIIVNSNLINMPSSTGTLALTSDLSTYVDLSSNQTLTNKTLTSPIISTINNSGVLTLPTGTNTIATVAQIPTNASFVDRSTNQSVGGVKTFSNTTQSTSPATGAIILSGGLGIAKDLYTNGGIYMCSSNTVNTIQYITRGSLVGPGGTNLVSSAVIAANKGFKITVDLFYYDSSTVPSTGYGSLLYDWKAFNNNNVNPLLISAGINSSKSEANVGGTFIGKQSISCSANGGGLAYLVQFSTTGTYTLSWAGTITVQQI